MQAIDIGYFNLTLDIEDAFEAKRGDIQERAEALTITKFKTTGGKPRPGRLALGAPSSRLAIEAGPSGRTPTSAGKITSPAGRRSTTDFSETPPPAYSNSLAANETSVVRANSTSSAWGAAAKKKGPAPPPPKPKPARLSGVPAVETVTALYDYEAQAEGDLSFSTGDVIEIVTRTNNDNEWWTGKVNGKTGQFPG
jgi:amphiphysin